MSKQRVRRYVCRRCEEPVVNCKCLERDKANGVVGRFPLSLSPSLVRVSSSWANKERYAVVIELGDNSTAAELRAAIPEALAWRDRLMAWQGRWWSGEKAFLEELEDRREHGHGPARLAREVNGKIEQYLRACLDGELYASANPEMARVAARIEGDNQWLELPNPFAWCHALEMTSVFIGETEARIELEAALDRIRSGDTAFLHDCPVSSDCMRETLRTYRHGPFHRAACAERAAQQRGGEK